MADPLRPSAKFVDTAMVPDDDDPSFDDDGQTFMRPGFAEHEMLNTLESPPIGDPQAQVTPQEAFEEMKYSAPLDEGERQILNETPFLGPELSFVDDADHAEWMYDHQRLKKNALDDAFEDQMYGELMDDESGWGFSSITNAVKKIGKGALKYNPATLALKYNPATLAAKALIKKFVPSRDAQKAALLRRTNSRLVQGRANFLQIADIRNGIKNRPRSYYVALAKPWSRSRLAAAGLPTSYTTGEVAASILGTEDMMGSWWNPFSWFQSKTNYVVQNAQGEITEMDQGTFNAWLAQQQAAQGDPSQAAVDPSQQPALDPSMDPSQQAAFDPSQMTDPSMDPSASQGDDDWTRAIDLHQMIEKAARGDQGALGALRQIKTKAARGDAQARSDMNEISNYQKETGMSVTGDEQIIAGSAPDYEMMVGDADEAGAFSSFAGEVTPARSISSSRYKQLTVQWARRMSGQTKPNAAALSAAHNRLAAQLKKRGISVVDSSGNSMMGAWLYKLSPMYWLKSERERKLIDAEKSNWQRTQDLAKANKKKGEELEAGKRAAYQHEQAKSAEQQSQEMEAQLEDIEKSITSGDLMGADAGPALEAIAAGKDAARGNAKKAGALAAKLEAGEPLSSDELARLRSCMKMCHHLRALHDELHAKVTPAAADTPPSTSGYHSYEQAKSTQSSFLGSRIGEPATEILGPTNTEIVGSARFQRPNISNLPVNKQRHLVALTAIAATNPAGISAYVKRNGLRLSARDMANIKIAAARTQAIITRPGYAKASMRGDSLMGDDSMGFSWGKLLTAPLAAAALPAAAITWGMHKVVQAPLDLIKWGARKGGWGGGKGSSSSSSTNPQALQAALKAAQQRQIAAQQRIAAANAATDAAQQQAAANAAAADAEAQAQQAEADAQQAQIDAQNPNPPGYGDGSYDDQSGSVSVLGAEFFSGAFVGEIDDPKAKKIVEEAGKNTPTGKKIRAGATLYHKAKKGDAKSKLAIAKIQAKAKAGDPQAQRDYNAVKAGKIAVHAKGRAHWKIALKRRNEAANKRGIAIRKRLEAKAGARLGEHTRRKKLAHIAKVEALAAKGHPKAKASVARTVARAKAGDKKAQTTVAALKLARHVRTAAKTPAERKRLHEAQKVVYKARKGNKKAIRQIALIDAAASHGQPNAKRAKARLNVAARVEHAVATGKIVPPSKNVLSHSAAKKHVKHVKNRIDLGIATREEALSAAKVARAAGDRKTAGAFALHASRLPSAKQPIKDAAAVAAAANNGSADAKLAIDNTLVAAQAGDPKAITQAGHLAAAQAVDAVNKGKPMPPAIAEATMTVERARAGDEEAKRTVARAGDAAQDPEHPNHDRGVEAAVALTAAATVASALAANAAAKKHWMNEAKKSTGTHIDSEEHGKAQTELAELMAKLHEGSATYAEGLRARNLAMSLDQPKVAAEISAIMPPRDTIDTPMSSLPDAPEPAIRGPMALLREALRALAFATPDPFANWREGIRSRGQG